MEKEKYYEYVNQYKKEHYSRITLLVTKEEGKAIRDYAAGKGLSTSAYIVTLVRNDMKTDIMETE